MSTRRLSRNSQDTQVSFRFGALMAFGRSYVMTLMLTVGCAHKAAPAERLLSQTVVDPGTAMHEREPKSSTDFVPRQPLNAEQMAFAGVWASDAYNLYISGVGSICVTLRTGTSYKSSSAPIASMSATTIVTNLWWMNHSLNIDRAPRVAGDKEQLGLAGRVWTRVAPAESVVVSRSGSWTASEPNVGCSG